MGEQVNDALQTLRQIEADFLQRLGRVVHTTPEGETLVFGNRWRRLLVGFAPRVVEWATDFPDALASDLPTLAADAPRVAGVPSADDALETLRAAISRPQALQVLRGVQSRLQQLQASLVSPALVGDQTVRQVTEQFVRQVAERGPFEFRDRRGRRWDLDAYADTSARTVIAQAQTEVRVSGMVADGLNLGRVSDSPLECPVCRPWEGRIVSLGSEAVEGYPSLRSAVRAGLFHPNCTHSIESVSQDSPSDETPEEDPEGFRLLQTQRRLERRSRVLQREQALWPKGSDEYRQAGAKRRAVRARIQGLVDQQPDRLRRRTERERLIRR